MKFLKWWKCSGKYLMLLSCGVNFLEYVGAEKFWVGCFVTGAVLFFCGEYFLEIDIDKSLNL